MSFTGSHLRLVDEFPEWEGGALARFKTATFHQIRIRGSDHSPSQPGFVR